MAYKKRDKRGNVRIDGQIVDTFNAADFPPEDRKGPLFDAFGYAKQKEAHIPEGERIKFTPYEDRDHVKAKVEVILEPADSSKIQALQQHIRNRESQFKESPNRSSWTDFHPAVDDETGELYNFHVNESGTGVVFDVESDGIETIKKIMSNIFYSTQIRGSLEHDETTNTVSIRVDSNKIGYDGNPAPASQTADLDDLGM